MAEKKKICARIKERWNSLDKTKVLIWSFLVLLVLPLVLYMYYFCGGISAEHKRWSEFGDYIAGIAGVLNVIAFVVLTVMIHKIEKNHKERNIQSHATELVLRNVQSQIEILDELYYSFQSYALKGIDEWKSKLLANETYERLQPLMVYVGCMKGTKLLPKETKIILEELHELLSKASNVFLCYALSIDEDNGEKMTFTNALMKYHELYRLLVKLEVTLTEDISGVEQEEDQSWKNEKKDIKTKISSTLK